MRKNGLRITFTVDQRNAAASVGGGREHGAERGVEWAARLRDNIWLRRFSVGDWVVACGFAQGREGRMTLRARWFTGK